MIIDINPKEIKIKLRLNVFKSILLFFLDKKYLKKISFNLILSEQ